MGREGEQHQKTVEIKNGAGAKNVRQRHGALRLKHHHKLGVRRNDAAAALLGSIPVAIFYSGDGGGTWHCVIVDQTCTVSEGAHDSPTTTIKMAAPDFLDLIGGKLNAMKAFTTGKLKISGDVMARKVWIHTVLEAAFQGGLKRAIHACTTIADARCSASKPGTRPATTSEVARASAHQADPASTEAGKTEPTRSPSTTITKVSVTRR